MKSNKISIANLNPVFQNPLKKFDLLHTEMMGNQAVITSVDTGSHWGSIKKENRPLGWEYFTEMEVREWSDSKHYDVPCDALDFRRRCPEGKLIYYDDLVKPHQRIFKEKMYECFPDELFDIVFSRLCIHCEWDPKLNEKKPIRKRIKERFLSRLPRGKPYDPPNRRAILKEIKALKLEHRKVTVDTLEKMWFDLDSKSVIMGSINFVTARLTGYKWFKDKLKVGKDQSLIQRLIELINTIISKLKGK